MQWLDTIHHGTAEDMHQIPSESTHLIVTSPPYNVGIQYGTHDDRMPEEAYWAMIEQVAVECHRALVPGGRMAWVMPNVDRRPRRPLAYQAAALFEALGFLSRGEIIWDKGPSVGTSTAWGTWCSPANPILRDTHEVVVVFSKGDYAMPAPVDAQPDITADEFTACTKSIWPIDAESAKRVGHPAPFPLELPARLIKLYSWPGQVVLDPFTGSGTTCLAANQLGRRYVGFDIDANYVQLARARLSTLFGLEVADA